MKAKYNKLTHNNLSLWEDIKLAYSANNKNVIKTIKYYLWLWF